tara:strand:- start:444 stop:893 length:450 start_codon:yes stop_codon:yes gene_type:complete
MNRRDRQYKDATSGAFIGWVGILLFCLIAVLFTGCVGTYYLTDAEYSDVRESHASLTYYNNQIYWGWNSGYYYYYGKPHYYPWYYYYNTCPPSHYNTTTHVIISKPVNRPTHRPNRPIYKTPHKSNKNKVIIHGSKRTNKTTIRRKPKK